MSRRKRGETPAFSAPDDEPPGLNPEEEAAEQDLFTEMLTDYRDGRDELNLSEFPISAVGSRSDPSLKTLRFQDVAVDKSTGKVIHRELVITGSDQWGLPTTMDDEVLLGLLQLSRLQGFQSPSVTFTPYQLLRILGWGFSSANYTRLKEAMFRWLGVTLEYHNAWRDKETGEWKKEVGFHIIEHVEFSGPGKRVALEVDGRPVPEGHSLVRWNPMVFRNFREGNLKTLDFHLYRSLKSGVAKRMFRFLDKRFYHRKSLSFELVTFACEKVGLSKPVKVLKPRRGETTGRMLIDAAQLKRRLLPAIRELEATGFLAPRDPRQRFTKDAAGVWQVHFEKSQAKEEEVVQGDLDLELSDISPLEGRLIGHGVTPAQARRLVSEFDPSRIEFQLDALEFLLIAKNGKAAPENRAGWLVKAITENYGPPRGFRSRAEREREARERAEKVKEQDQRLKARLEAEEAREKAAEEERLERERRVREYLESLKPAQRQALEEEAIRKSPLAGGRLGAHLRAAIIHNYVEALLKERDDFKLEG